MQPIGCGLLPPRGDSVKKFSAFTGLEERYRSKILLPLGLLAESSRQTGYGIFILFRERWVPKTARKIPCIHCELRGRNYLQN